MLPRRVGISLVELLVAIAIIAILVSLTLAALPGVRESSRSAACINNLRQLGLGLLQHEGSHQFFPTGGWGADWVGDPDRGFGQGQPGGWVYNILPYIEQNALREIGRGHSSAAKAKSMVRLLESPLGVMICPSRRGVELFPYHGPRKLKNVVPPLNTARSDYAISGMVSFRESEMNSADLESGLSKTILAGEKSVDRRSYETGTDAGDRLTMYVGDSTDVRREIVLPVVFDKKSNAAGFGSAHPSGCHMLSGDASVRLVAFGTDLQSGAGANP